MKEGQKLISHNYFFVSLAGSLDIMVSNLTTICISTLHWSDGTDQWRWGMNHFCHFLLHNGLGGSVYMFYLLGLA